MYFLMNMKFFNPITMNFRHTYKSTALQFNAVFNPKSLTKSTTFPQITTSNLIDQIFIYFETFKTC